MSLERQNCHNQGPEDYKQTSTFTDCNNHQMSPNECSARPYHELEPPEWSALRELCSANLEHFGSYQDESSSRIKGALTLILDTLETLRSDYGELSRLAPLFDFDENTPGNGYRSFLLLVDKAIEVLSSACHELHSQKNSVLFRKTYHMKEIEASSQLLASLCTCLQHAKTLYDWRQPMEGGQYSLFPSDDHSPYEILRQTENINQYCFYGRLLGFQFCPDMKKILKALLLGMASFSEIFYANGTLLGRCTNSIQYLVDPDARARRIVTISQHADISFCKAFWHLNESDLMLSLPQLVMPSVSINQIITISPEELEYTTLSGSVIKIPIPNSHIGKKPIRVRLISSKRRIGMVGSGNVRGQLAEQSESLIIHCHGGGFVAQSSRSHESYLRTWTTELDTPILSIDYSLAPEAPYPRALEEVLYAYVWALKHADTFLGSTAKRVVFAGDSAGANLNLVTAIRCLELDIRPPDGIFMAYSPTLLDFVMSPARLLCLTDPILPFGFLMRCLKAYAATDPAKESSEQELDDELVELDKSDTESFAEVSAGSDLIALALSPTGDDDQDSQKLPSLASDATLNSVSSTEVDTIQDMCKNVKLGSSAPTLHDTTSRESDGADDPKSWSFFGWNSDRNNGRKQRHLELKSSGSFSEEFMFEVPKDSHLSPYRTPDSLLQRLPPVKILTLELDPCLDDCVMFAKKLRYLGRSVSMDILSGLPHGFLNFSVFSKEAYGGSLLCAKRIRELLET